MNRSTHDAARIAAELAALGEPEHAALASARADEDVDVAVVTALFGLAHGAGPELSEIERRRVWRRLEARRSPRPQAGPSAGHSLWIGIAAAVALLLAPTFAVEHSRRELDPETRAALLATGQIARRSLAEMPGGQDGARARALADEYGARLRGSAAATADGSVR